MVRTSMSCQKHAECSKLTATSCADLNENSTPDSGDSPRSPHSSLDSIKPRWPKWRSAGQNGEGRCRRRGRGRTSSAKREDRFVVTPPISIRLRRLSSLLLPRLDQASMADIAVCRPKLRRPLSATRLRTDFRRRTRRSASSDATNLGCRASPRH